MVGCRASGGEGDSAQGMHPQIMLQRSQMQGHATKKKKKSSEEDSKPVSKVDKGPRINTAAYADELFNLTGELQASNKELAKATHLTKLTKVFKMLIL